ncbi:MAG: UDP-N-acetylglucosamine 2-epimerase (non-hydrolyzing) [Chloroflexota bacterium]
MKIVSVVGTRPQLIKAAVLQPVLRARHHEVFVDTGQHWDQAMAGTFLDELEIERPDHSLAAGGGGHAEQTAAMLTRLEPVILAERPDIVLVYGDTNSTLAGALVAAKLGIPVAHVEAGLRSFDRRMPEEMNRVMVDHLSTWLFAPTPSAVSHLRDEGITRGVTLVGDLMQDLAARVSRLVKDERALDAVGARLARADPRLGRLHPGAYLFATIHRAENREPESMRAWVSMLDRVSGPDRPVILALHPGTRAALEHAELVLGPDVLVIEPQGYRTSLALQVHAAAVLTDSGGVQREAGWLGVPCLVLRSTTEWTEAVLDSGGDMRLVGTDTGRAQAALAELAPANDAPRRARARAEALDVASAGAAQAILDALDREP